MKKLFLLIPVVFSFNAWAQDAQSTDNEQNSQAEQQVLDTEPSPEELAAAENDELILGADGGELKSDQQDEDENSNSRFIPTEEISQDLGVSFPVDI